jgi:hypothetical protein
MNVLSDSAKLKGKSLAKKKSPLENLFVLLILGLLAGAVGGLGVGLIQLRSVSQAASSAAAK